MEDAKILSMYFDRDETAISETEQKYGNYCRSIAQAILADPRDAEECVNDALVRVWNSIPPNEPQNLKFYLIRIVRNLSFDRYRLNTAAKRKNETDLILEELEECIGSAVSAEDAVITSELSSSINRFLQGLNDRDRNIFLRRYFFNESASAIGKRYGIKESNTRLILSRTRQKLKKHLESEELI